MFVYKKTIICLLFFFFLSPVFLTGQIGKIEFNNNITKDKCPTNYITDICQDHTGFLWFSAYGVLIRFDGYEFYQYFPSKKKPFSLSSGMINCLFVDKEGELWIGTYRGLNKYNKDKDNFQYFRNTFSDKELIINNICQDTKGLLWITTQTGIYKFDPKSRKFTEHYIYSKSDPNTIRNDYVFSCYCDKKGELWFGTRGYLSKYQTEHKNFINYPVNKTLGIKTIYEDCNNVLWLGTIDQGLVRFSRSDISFEIYSTDNISDKKISNNNIFSILEDKSGTFWVATQNGLNVFNRNNKEFITYYHSQNDNSLTNNSTTCLMLDKTEVLWIGTSNGLSAIDRHMKLFYNHSYKLGNWTSNNTESVTSFCHGNSGKIWFSTTSNKFFEYDVLKKTTHEFKYQSARKKKENRSSIRDIYYENGNVWLGTDGDGLIKFNTKTKKYRSFILPDTIESTLLKNEEEYEYICNNYINSIYKDSFDNYWVGTWNGFNKLNFKKGKAYFTCYKYDSENLSSISHNVITCITEDNNNTLWFGTLGGGLNKLVSNRNKKTLKFKAFKTVTDDSTSILSNEIQHIVDDKNGNIWIGTNGGGINKLNLSTEKISGFQILNKQHNNNVYSIIQDNNGNLWLGSNGLSKFNTQTNEITSYGMEDGLISSFFMEKSCIMDDMGIIYFGVNNGIIKFHPNSIKINPYNPEKIVITDIKLFNKSIKIDTLYENEILLNKHISITDTIIFPHHLNSITLEFSSLHFSNPGMNMYAYILDGFDNDWSYTSPERRFATYTNLEPGQYQFKVKASNNDNIWNNKGISLCIIIRPPFWKTWWFRIGIFLLGVSLVLLFHALRVKYLKKQRVHLQKMVNKRTEQLNEANSRLEEHYEEIQEQKEELLLTLDELQETQAQLIQSEKMASLGILTGGIAHEINNPLNFIQGGNWAISEYVKDNLQEHGKNLSPLIDAITEGISRIAIIINSLRKFNHSNESMTDQCNVEAIIENCLIILENKLKHKIKIEKSYSNTKCKITCNESALHQVILNILSNSIESIEEKGIISIETNFSNHILNIKISDSGRGINTENIKKITDPFFTTKEPGKGIGLGMSIAYSIIKQHKGSITYQSELGKGTVADLIFPIK